MENITKSGTVIKKYRDDWIDVEGKLHTKFIIEIITGPIILGKQYKLPEMKDFQGQIPSLLMTKNLFPQQRPQIQQRPQMPQRQQMTFDFNQFMQMGKKFLESSGINLKDVLGELTGKRKTSSGEEYEPDEAYNSYVADKVAEEKAKEELDNMVVPETKPLKDQKEVKKWEKTKKQKKQNQKKQMKK